MEEKERYIIGKGENITVVDNDRKVIFIITTAKLQDLLNKQDKENEQLKQQLAESEKEHELLIDQFEEETEKLRKQIKQESDARKRFVEEVKNLKQQIHDLPKKIVEEIKNSIKTKYPFVTATIGEENIFKSCFTIRMESLYTILNSILKKYGEENE